MSLPQNYTIKEHAYLWRADGSSGTQGTGSIVNYPTLTGGTASATATAPSDSGETRATRKG